MDCLTPGGDISYHVEVVKFLGWGAGIVRELKTAIKILEEQRLGFILKFS